LTVNDYHIEENYSIYQLNSHEEYNLNDGPSQICKAKKVHRTDIIPLNFWVGLGLFVAISMVAIYA
jgi:hypothetical protein